jgi:magnesium transporter
MMLQKDTATEAFSYFSSEQKADIINVVTDKELKYILNELFFGKRQIYRYIFNVTIK